MQVPSPCTPELSSSYIKIIHEIFLVLTDSISRIRRIKCDEGKPDCAKCIKSGRVCERYETLGTPSPRALQPKQSVEHARSVSPRSLSPFPNAFSNEEEALYFTHFRLETSRQLSWYVEDGFWSHKIPQVCFEELSLRSLAVAIAALSKSQNGDEMAATHRDFALQQYGMALKEAHTAINSRGEPDATRIALISSLLIYCFENLQGDCTQAGRHMEAALKLVQKKLVSRSFSFWSVRDNSAHSTLDQQLLLIFMRIDNGFQFRDVDEGQEPSTTLLLPNYLSEGFKIPSRFTGFVEARNYLEEFQHSMLLPILRREDTHAPPFQSDAERASTGRKLQQHLQEWNDAFAPLLAAVDGGHLAIAATLQALALATSIGIQTLCTPPELLFSVLEPFIAETEQIVRLCKSVILHPSFQKSFVFDCGVIRTLWMVIKSGTRRDIREEAVRLCWAAVGRREMVFEADAEIVARYGEAVLEAELQQPGTQLSIKWERDGFGGWRLDTVADY